jgi:hypothetical protein
MAATQQALLMASDNAVTVPEACEADPYYSCGPTNDPYWANVVLMLHMDGTNGSTTFTDSSSLSRTPATNTNVAITTDQSKFGGAAGERTAGSAILEYAYSTDFSYAGSNAYTIEFWLFLQEAGATEVYFLGQRSGTGKYFRITTAETMFFRADGAAELSFGTIPKDVWTHIAVSCDTSTVRSFVNGEEISSAAASSYTDTTTTALSIFSASGLWSTAGLVGYLDDLRITKGVARYTGNFNIPTAAFPDALDSAWFRTMQNTVDAYAANTVLQLHMETDFSDSSSYNRTPTVNGNATIAGTANRFNLGGGVFDGTTDYVQYPNSADFQFGTGDFTVEFWVNTASITNGPYIVSFRDGTNQGWYVVFASTLSGAPSFYSNGPVNGLSLTTSGALANNVWRHIAFSRVSGVLYGFINGIAGGSVANTVNYSGVASALAVGADYNGTNSLTGFVDDVRITKGVGRYTANFVPDGERGRTVLSLHAEDTDDSSCYQPKTVTLTGSAAVSTAEKQFGTASFSVANAGTSTANGVVITDHMDFDFGTGDFTIEMWAYHSSNDYAGTLFYYTESSAFSLVVAATTGLVTLNYRSSGGAQANIATGVVFPLTTWQQVVVQRRGTNFEFYLNGVLGNTTAITGGASSTVNSTGDFYLGRTNASSALTWAGYIDEVRITKGVARYPTAFTPPAQPNCDSVVPGNIVAVPGTSPLTGMSVAVQQQTIGDQNGAVALSGVSATVNAGGLFSDSVTSSKTVALLGRSVTVSRGTLSVPKYPNLVNSVTPSFLVTSPTVASLTVTFRPDGTWTAIDGEGATRISGTWIDTTQTAYAITSISHQYRVVAVSVFVGYAPYYSYPTTPFTLSSDFVFVAQNLTYVTTVNFDFQITISPTSTNPRYAEAFYSGTHRITVAIELN